MRLSLQRKYICSVQLLKNIPTVENDMLSLTIMLRVFDGQSHHDGCGF